MPRECIKGGKIVYDTPGNCNHKSARFINWANEVCCNECGEVVSRVVRAVGERLVTLFNRKV